MLFRSPQQLSLSPIPPHIELGINHVRTPHNFDGNMSSHPILGLHALGNDITRIWITLSFPVHKVGHLQLIQCSVLKVVDGCIEDMMAGIQRTEFKKGDCDYYVVRGKYCRLHFFIVTAKRLSACQPIRSLIGLGPS